MRILNKLKSLIGNRSPIRLGWHYGKAFLAALINWFPARNLTVIGITGTDGKTTTVSMTAHILLCAGIPTGALSTAFLQVKEDIQWNETQKTSPSPFLVQQFLKKLVQNNCSHAVLEVSSHGLVQGRVNHINFAVAAITNTSMEHLDYHGSLEQYRKDKGKLFKMLKGKGTKVLNYSDETYKLYSAIPTECTFSYSFEKVPSAKCQVPNSHLWLSNILTKQNKTSATLHHNLNNLELGPWTLELSLPGSFNLENALCAISCAVSVGVNIEEAVEALKSFRGAPGRMELIDEGQPFSVYVDFTVTPAAYKKTLTTLRQMIEPENRILVLTGSCGDRMKEKRPIVGKICSQLADVVVVTNEDPYTENPEKIIHEVWTGVDKNQCEAHRISDRREAMEFLLKQAQPGDAVILCAKGSDTTMWTAGGQIPWDERGIAKELLKELRMKN
ncbi:UDP-N-acetylmuramoyl-L-alanyl-D-glutamate--2,6-diaminopimelate ligase [Patescibacteria group bacterium]|nr:UDP-N-acetylmuramoyl-L-alanyl-D-glutamate--2,6-diaminopimelate ligase [Patescibacteria group bacterium]